MFTSYYISVIDYLINRINLIAINWISPMSLVLPSNLSFSENLQSLSQYYQGLLSEHEPIVDEAKAGLQAVEVLLSAKGLTSGKKLATAGAVKGPGRGRKADVATEPAPAGLQSVKEPAPSLSVVAPTKPRRGPAPKAKNPLKAAAKVKAPKASAKTKVAATPTKGRPRRNSLLQFTSVYQGKTLTDAVEQILRERVGKAVSIEDVVQVLYGDLSSDLFKIAKDRVTKNLSKGKMNGLWDRVPDRLGFYILKR
jgi:hypothetical protein